MKSIHHMTASEMQSARESKEPFFGTVMYRFHLHDNGCKETLYSDLEDYDPVALLALIEVMKDKGWRELEDNRYHRAGKHPSQKETVHMCPPDGSGLTPCCGKAPFELPKDSRMAIDASLVTCKENQI